MMRGGHTQPSVIQIFFVTALEESPSESEGEDGEDLPSDEEQDLQDQLGDPVDDDAETEDHGLDLECGMTDSSDSPIIHCHSKRLQNISSSDSELSSEPVRFNKQKADVSKSTLTTQSESEESVACVGEKSYEQVLPAPKVN